MNKPEQIQYLALNCGLEKERAESVLKAIGAMVLEALSTNGTPDPTKSIKIEGLGTYDIRKTAAKSGSNPAVLTARKAVEAGTATDEHKALLVKVEAGEVKETYEKPEGLKLFFKAEKAVSTRLNPTSDPTGEDDEEPAAE
jgi:nucleoid DNA-binding protein